MINLLPPQYKESIRFGRLNTRTLHYLILTLTTGIGLAAILLFGFILASREERLLIGLADDKQASLNQYSAELSQAKTLAGRIDTIAALLDRETAFSKLLPGIGAVVPPGTTISGLELDTADANALSINGESANQNGPSIFRENLAKTTELFARADIVSITLVENETGPDTYAFQINVQFAPGAKQEL
jgi:hypothetical protein